MGWDECKVLAVLWVWESSIDPLLHHNPLTRCIARTLKLHNRRITLIADPHNRTYPNKGGARQCDLQLSHPVELDKFAATLFSRGVTAR